MSKPTYSYGSEVIPWEDFGMAYEPTDEEKKEMRKKARLAKKNDQWNQEAKPSPLLDELEDKPMMNDLPF